MLFPAKRSRYPISSKFLVHKRPLWLISMPLLTDFGFLRCQRHFSSSLAENNEKVQSHAFRSNYIIGKDAGKHVSILRHKRIVNAQEGKASVKSPQESKEVDMEEDLAGVDKTISYMDNGLITGPSMVRTMKEEFSQLPKPITIAQMREYVEKFESVYSFIECLNIINTPVRADAIGADIVVKSSSYAAENAEKEEHVVIDPYSYNIALAAGMRSLFNEEAASLILNKELSGTQRSKFYHTVYTLYYNMIYNFKIPLDAYVFETMLIKMKRMREATLMIEVAQAMKKIEEKEERRLLNTYHYNLILASLSDITSAAFLETFKDMKNRGNVDVKSFHLVVEWQAKYANIEDIKKSVLEITQNEKLLLEESPPILPESETKMKMEDTIREKKEMFYFFATVQLIKNKRINEALEMYEELVEGPSYKPKMSRIEFLYLILLKCNPYDHLVTQRFLSMVLKEESDGERAWVVRMKGIDQSGGEADNNTVNRYRYSFLGKIVKIIGRNDPEGLIKCIKGLKNYEEGGKKTVDGYNLLLSVQTDARLSPELKSKALNVYSERCLDETDLSSSAISDQNEENKEYDLINKLSSFLAPKTMDVFKLMYRDKIIPNIQTFNILLNSFASTNPLYYKINDEQHQLIYYHLLSFLEKFMTECEGRHLDNTGLNILLEMSRRENDYKTLLRIIRILKASRGMFFSANLDISTQEPQLMNYLSVHTVLPNKATLKELKAKILGDDENYQHVLNEDIIDDWISQLNEKNTKGLRIQTVGDLRKLRQADWKSIFPSLSSEAIHVLLKSCRTPYFHTDKVPWIENKASIQGSAKLRKGVVQLKSGRYVYTENMKDLQITNKDEEMARSSSGKRYPK